MNMGGAPCQAAAQDPVSKLYKSPKSNCAASQACEHCEVWFDDSNIIIQAGLTGWMNNK
jgi:hypothetical protein